ncbi:unnamed protein product [Camellia sinensis]
MFVQKNTKNQAFSLAISLSSLSVFPRSALHSNPTFSLSDTKSSSISLDPAYITRYTMQDFIGSVCRSLVFKPSDDGGVFGGFVEKIGSIIRKSGIGLFSKPPVPALPLIAKSDAIKVKKDDAPIAKSTAIKVKKDDAPTIRWRKGELIGCGAFGRVYMGLNIDSGALLAIKQVSIAGNSAAKEKTQAHIRELEEEVNLLENLSHPNIVRYLGTTREDASLNILLEIVPGGSISSLLGKFGSFPESVIRMYTKQLLLGVEYLHKNGIMHRDIKGANILVDNKGCIKLADFGASKKVVELATMTGAKSMKGTPYWMAPEVILQTGHSFSADIWSVGCTVIEMATGKPPWSQQYQEVAALLHIGTTKSHPPIPEHLSAEATDFLLKCLQKEPNLRPAASDLLQHPFVTREHQETYPVLRASVKENSGKKMATPEMELKNSMDPIIRATYTQLKDVHNSVRCSTIYPEKFPENVPHWGSGNCDDDMCQIDDEDDLVIGASGKFDFTLLSDDFNKRFNPMFEPDDNWPCKFDDTPEKFPGNVPHWGSGNCDGDMCQIDDEDEFVIGASGKFDSALLYDDFNKSFNPMSEPNDNWPCKSDDTLELESKVNLLSGQTVNKATDIPRASGKGNNDFTFPCGPSVAEDDDDDNEVIESKIRAFLDEKGLEVDYLGSGHCDVDMCQIDDEDDFVIGVSAKFDSALLSDDFNESFNPMSEPDDNWPCKSDDTPELESRVNLFSGQTVNKSADITRASGKGNNDFTFPYGPLVAEDDDDEVLVAKYGLGRGGWCLGRVGLTHGRGVWKGIWLGWEAFWRRVRFGTYSQCVSNIGTESVQTLSQVQPPKPSEWKEIVRDDQELINPSTSFCERKRIWKEELYEELERKRGKLLGLLLQIAEHKQQEVCGLENSVSTAYGSWEEITIWVSSISFHEYAEITFQSTSDVSIYGGKGDYRSEICSPVSIVSKGEILQQNTTNAHNSDSNSYLKTDCSDFEVIRVVVGTMPVGHLYSRLVPLVLILVHGSNPIDIIDPRCEILLIVQKKIDLQGGNQLRLLGFAAIYRFYHYPDSLRLRLSQIFVLPPYQRKGYGRHLLEVLNNVAVCENVYDLTIEEPLDSLQHVRTCIDVGRLLVFNRIQKALNSTILRDLGAVEKRLNYFGQNLLLNPSKKRMLMKQNNSRKKRCKKILANRKQLLLKPTQKRMSIKRRHNFKYWKVMMISRKNQSKTSHSSFHATKLTREPLYENKLALQPTIEEFKKNDLAFARNSYAGRSYVFSTLINITTTSTLKLQRKFNNIN